MPDPVTAAAVTYLYRAALARQVPHLRLRMRGGESSKEELTMALHTPDRTPFSIRYPLLVRGALVLLVMGLARLFIALGWIPAEWALDEKGIEQAFDGLLVAWAWFSSQRKVTPVADPRDAHGRPLVVQGRVEPPY
jgi:hypothetical protein